MSFSRLFLEDHLLEIQGTGARPARYLVAFSGGLDSTVLLHALCATETSIPIVAIHVDHQLSHQSVAWEAHCRAVAESLGVQYIDRKADVGTGSGFGPEAAARAARYAIFESLVEDNDWLLSAHHQSDQAETLFLNLFRGSGPAGLSGIGSSRHFSRGTLARPMLSVTKQQIQEYANREALHWIEDPSNNESRFDRNFLRNEIIPKLVPRWPELIARLNRSAELARESMDLLDDLAKIDLRGVGQIDRLEIEALSKLHFARQRNLLRYAIRQLGLQSPPSTRLSQIVNELMSAREDAQPLVAWPGVEVRRYRGRIYLLAEIPPLAESANPRVLREGGSVILGPGLGELSLQLAEGLAIDPSVVAAGLEIRFRAGGESIRPVGRGNSHKLKTLLQDAAVVPWMRERIPLLYSGENLVAIADLWTAAEFTANKGLNVVWDDRPTIT